MAKLTVGTVVTSGLADGDAVITWYDTGTAAGTLAVAPGGEVFLIPTSAPDKALMKTKSDTVAREGAEGETA